MPIFSLEMSSETFTVGDIARARISMDWTKMGYSQSEQSEIGWFVNSCVISGAGRQIALIGSGEKFQQNDKCWLNDPYDRSCSKILLTPTLAGGFFEEHKLSVHHNTTFIGILDFFPQTCLNRSL